MATNLLSTEGMRVVIGDAAKTFGAFAPLGQVLIIMLGIAWPSGRAGSRSA